MNTFQKLTLISFCGFLVTALIAFSLALRLTVMQSSHEPATTNTPTQIPTAVSTPFATAVPTMFTTPVNPIRYSQNDFAGVNVSAQDVMYLAALCVVETKSFRDKRDDACKAVVSTVFKRAVDRVMSDGTVAGTITWDCKQGDIACQFPAYVVNGCGNIRPDMCPYNYSQHLIYYASVVENFVVSDRETSCPFYLFYDLREGGVDCRIEENGQFINFHDGLD